MTPGRLAQVACVLEASARKPGNIHRFCDFDDCGYLDFVMSALAIGPALDLAASEGVGAAVLGAIEATRRVSRSNTNLGMVLLLAPMAAVREAGLQRGPHSEPHGEFRQKLCAVLQATTVDDARLAYQAIRLANPGGLGTADEQDVAEEPTVTLAEAMGLAADHDLVARQYGNGYSEVFDIALPGLESSIRQGRDVETAIIQAHLGLLAAVPDTLIVRKQGMALAVEAMGRARLLLDAGRPDRPEGERAFEEFDGWLRSDGHSRNPGATADLVAAALFAALRSGTIALPMATWSSPAGR